MLVAWASNLCRVRANEIHNLCLIWGLFALGGFIIITTVSWPQNPILITVLRPPRLNRAREEDLKERAYLSILFLGFLIIIIV